MTRAGIRSVSLLTLAVALAACSSGRLPLVAKGALPIGSLVIYIVLAGLAFAESRSRPEGWWRKIAVLILGGLAVGVFLRGGIDPRALFRSPPVFDIFAMAGAGLIAIDLVGLPLPIARRLRLGLHSREWDFDRRLYALTEKARRVAESPGAGGGRDKDELTAIVAGIRRLRAPDQDWAAVRDGWASAWEQYLDLLTMPVDGATREEALVSQRVLIERTVLLRVRYRTDASRILGKGS